MRNPSAVLYAAEDLRIEDRSVPAPGPGDVLVRVRAVGVCGSDIHYYEQGRIGDYVVASPMVLGHEAAGEIVEVGADVDPSRVGQTVALEPGVPCRTCQQCRSGRYNLCPDIVFFATPPVDGALARYVTIDAAFAHPAPEGMTFEHAAMAEPVSVGVWAARKAGVGIGDRVLVTGAGPVGLYAAQVARAAGAEHVALTDLNERRIAAAARLGFEARRPDEELPGRFDVLLECSGAPAALAGGMARLAPAARVVLVGMGADTVSLELPSFQGREVTLAGVFRYANTYPAALALIATGQVDVDSTITHRFPLEQTVDAMTVLRRDPGSLKSVILP
ncbi:NAD(P)-dependent alcohol dehydrogenase [Microbacterium sp. Y-01]|uniref:NAD(P)-dependent alcohol dehydrogenase n=1 Tax=Microbacterium sp. Y-01 TaxID=2048898 RepID=UPI000F5D56BF|nr:NAD(P)-dependent alcohol dehydrogenase [Microbacterium sp. Y-01]AZH79319.1 NAD(P)-dependent alcohol dehydrogenase [Microbacterium sp. Y-01]